MEKLWTTNEVAQCLGIRETDVEQLVKEGKLTGYKLGGQFLRFRPDQVEALKATVKPRDPEEVAEAPPPKDSVGAQFIDFIYYYDFYLVSAALLAAMVSYLIATR